MGTPKKSAGKAEAKSKTQAVPVAASTTVPPEGEPNAGDAAPVSPAVQAAADEPQAPAAEEVAQAKESPAVWRVERARALLELPASAKTAKLVADGIQSFKDTDRRTMNVVVAGGQLYKQEV
jgi:cell pole-organizing protein PopZ